MAADGAWPQELGEPGDEHTRRAVDQLRAILGDLEGRLAAPVAPALAPEALDTLVIALQALAARIARLEADHTGRFGELGGALGLLAERLETQVAGQAAIAERAVASEARINARLDLALAELAETRAEGAAAAEPPLIRAILLAASAAAALSVMGAAVIAVSQVQNAPPASVTSPAAVHELPLRRGLRLPPRVPVVAVAPGTPIAPVAPTNRPAGEYEAVTAALARGDATALPRLTGLADAGDPRAQLDLAGAYEQGAFGLPQDLVAARQWTARAAQAGERVAMHNYGLFLMEGQGGPRDVTEAAKWFRRASDRGVVDSQYNLGLLYEAGRGVERNLREAYRWFAIAANAGDLTAREKMVSLEPRLNPTERAGLDRDVSGFRPGAEREPDPAVVIPPATTIAETQAMLARQGYYVGPIDGVAGPTLRSAATAYLRDHPGVTTP